MLSRFACLLSVFALSLVLTGCSDKPIGEDNTKQDPPAPVDGAPADNKDAETP